jgi:hypothetical protein
MFYIIKKIAKYTFFALSSIALLINQPCVVNADKSISINNINFEFKGQSGQIGLHNSITGKETSIKWKKIEEYNTQNQKVNFVNNFASQVFNWNTPKSIIYNNKNCTLIKLNSILNTKYNLSNPVFFNISTFIFTDGIQLPYGNTTITVPKNTIKFELNMEGWPFSNSNNTLQFGAEIKQENKDGKNKSLRDLKKFKINKFNRKVNDDDKHTFNDRTLIMDDSSFYDMPSFAIINGIQTPIITSPYNDTDDNKIGIMWTFPSFKTLIYDPVVGTGTPDYIYSSSSNSNTIESNYIVYILIMISIFFFY